MNLVVDKLEELYPCEMKDEFYPRHCLNKTGEMPGGKFNLKRLAKHSGLPMANTPKLHTAH